MLTSRPFVIALATMASSACFDPMVDPVGSGSETDGSTTDPSASSTLDTDSAEGPLDSTGSLDAPPEITAFTINGSTMPAEQQLAGLIELDITYTHSGDLVLVGSVPSGDDDRVGWATRVQEDGTAVWEQIYSIGTTASGITGVAVSSSGRLYVSGIAEMFV